MRQKKNDSLRTFFKLEFKYLKMMLQGIVLHIPTPACWDPQPSPFFWPCPMTCGILICWLGIWTLETQSLNPELSGNTPQPSWRSLFRNVWNFSDVCFVPGSESGISPSWTNTHKPREDTDTNYNLPGLAQTCFSFVPVFTLPDSDSNPHVGTTSSNCPLKVIMKIKWNFIQSVELLSPIFFHVLWLDSFFVS